VRDVSQFRHGIPCVDWLARWSSGLIQTCSGPAFVLGRSLLTDRFGLVAIDGKTPRRSHNRKHQVRLFNLHMMAKGDRENFC
jgi:hypothetical protein